MKTKYLISSVILISSFIIISSVIAADIQYPVEELGNCQNEAACKSYCDQPENMEACLNFAEKNNLMSPEELEMAKKFMAAGGQGPGGCRGKDECETYCNNIEHIDECISFGEENNLIPPEELEEAKKVQAAIARGVKPPPCGNKRQCDIYCEEPNHMEECINFGIEAGFIQGEELEDVQKMLAALKRGVKPPPCKGKQACDEYCSNPDNMEVCMNFALEAGFMSDQEKADSQKMLQALKKGIKPPNCRGKEECDIYCAEESHFEECMKFAEAAGFMTPEDAEMARKTGGKGPGGCKGKEECEAFCNNPENQETCFNFGKEHGLIPEEDLRKMEEGKQELQETFRNAPPQVLECLKSTLGTEILDKIQGGSLMPGPQIGDQVRICFEQFRPGPPEGMAPPEGQMPPEGMMSPEGMQFSPPPGYEGQMPPEGMMMPPEGWQEGQMPPEGMMMPPSGDFMQPPSSGEFMGPPPNGEMMGPPPAGEMAPPPSGESAPPPPTSWNTKSIMGVILGPFLDIFR